MTFAEEYPNLASLGWWLFRTLVAIAAGIATAATARWMGCGLFACGFLGGMAFAYMGKD